MAFLIGGRVLHFFFRKTAYVRLDNRHVLSEEKTAGL